MGKKIVALICSPGGFRGGGGGGVKVLEKTRILRGKGGLFGTNNIKLYWLQLCGIRFLCKYRGKRAKLDSRVSQFKSIFP